MRQQIVVFDIGTDRRQAENSRRPGNRQRMHDAVDHRSCLGIAGLRVEHRRRKDEHGRCAAECRCQRRCILHFGQRDFTPELGPLLPFASVTHNSADGLSRREQGARKLAPDFASDPRDGIHRRSPFDLDSNLPWKL